MKPEMIFLQKRSKTTILCVAPHYKDFDKQNNYPLLSLIIRSNRMTNIARKKDTFVQILPRKINDKRCRDSLDFLIGSSFMYTGFVKNAEFCDTPY